MRQSSLAAAAALLLAKAALGLMPGGMGTPKESLMHLRLLPVEEGAVSNGTFQQLIDHNHPEKGTFTQHYFYNADFYRGPGSPIIVMSPGEQPLAGFEAVTTNQSLLGVLAQRTGAAVIAIEHRYWGDSSPYGVLTADNLTYLTLNNSIRDMTHFAKAAVLPFDRNRTSTPDKAPWVLSGCSYFGALSAWTSQLDPGVFWAYQASSAVTQAIKDLWEYYEVVGQAMPKNCSTDYVKMIDAVDSVLLGNNQWAKNQLKTKFGLAGLRDDDFAASLLGPLSVWQSNRFSGGYSNFSRMCDYIENQWPGSREPVPSAAGVGAAKALDGYAKFISGVWLFDACSFADDWQGPYSTDCLDSHNTSSTVYTNLAVSNAAGRQWVWFLCNEPFEWWQDRGYGRFVSRLLTTTYFSRQCEYYFPNTKYGLKQGRTVGDVNKLTGGWFGTNTPRVAWTVGELDPWRPATPMSASRPGGALVNTAQHPVQIVPRAAHCSDTWMGEYAANAGLRTVMDANMKVLQEWIEEFYKEKGVARPGYYL